MDTGRTYLIQRLLVPNEATPQGDWNEKANRVFGEGGGGLGLSDEARKLFRYVCSFDYMGAAEFEYGAIPTALGTIAKRDLVAFEFVLDAKNIRPAWWRESLERDLRRKELDAARAAGKRAPRKKKPNFDPIQDKTFYVLCPRGFEEYVKAVIINCAKGEQRLKEGIRFEWVLDPEPNVETKKSWRHNIVGWLELNHGFFFFVDKQMFERMCEIFQVKPGEGKQDGEDVRGRGDPP